MGFDLVFGSKWKFDFAAFVRIEITNFIVRVLLVVELLRFRQRFFFAERLASVVGVDCGDGQTEQKRYSAKNVGSVIGSREFVTFRKQQVR